MINISNGNSNTDKYPGGTSSDEHQLYGDGVEKELRGLILTVILNIALFTFVAFMVANVSIDNIKSTFKAGHRAPLFLGLCIQFFVNPAIGLFIISVLPNVLNLAEKVVLLVIMSSPGGTYSNLLASVFNADLALSVSMSAISTLASAGFLPLNLFIYVQLVIGVETVLDFKDLVTSIFVVEGGVILGLLLSYRFPTDDYKFLSTIFLIISEISAILLFGLGLGLSQSEESLRSKSGMFFLVCFLAVTTSICVSTFLTNTIGSIPLCRVHGPQKLTVILETLFQNTSISIAVAFSTFPEAVAAQAANITVLQGLYQFISAVMVLIIGWKLGLSYAPSNTTFFKYLCQTWQPGSSNYKKLHDDDSEASDVETSSAATSTPEAGQGDLEHAAPIRIQMA